MKYETPKYEKATIETEDILSASSQGFEITTEEETGKGKIQLDFSNLFNI